MLLYHGSRAQGDRVSELEETLDDVPTFQMRKLRPEGEKGLAQSLTAKL